MSDTVTGGATANNIARLLACPTVPMPVMSSRSPAEALDSVLRPGQLLRCRQYYGDTESGRDYIVRRFYRMDASAHFMALQRAVPLDAYSRQYVSLACYAHDLYQYFHRYDLAPSEACPLAPGDVIREPGEEPRVIADAIDAEVMTRAWTERHERLAQVPERSIGRGPVGGSLASLVVGDRVRCLYRRTSRNPQTGNTWTWEVGEVKAVTEVAPRQIGYPRAFRVEGCHWLQWALDQYFERVDDDATPKVELAPSPPLPDGARVRLKQELMGLRAGRRYTLHLRREREMPGARCYEILPGGYQVYLTDADVSACFTDASNEELPQLPAPGDMVIVRDYDESREFPVVRSLTGSFVERYYGGSFVARICTTEESAEETNPDRRHLLGVGFSDEYQRWRTLDGRDLPRSEVVRRAQPPRRSGVSQDGEISAIPEPGDILTVAMPVPGSALEPGAKVKLLSFNLKPDCSLRPNELGVATVELPGGSSLGLFYPTVVFLEGRCWRQIPGPKYRNILTLTPREADQTVLQLAPVPRLTTFVPARERQLTFYHDGHETKRTTTTPSAAWVMALTVTRRGGLKPVPGHSSDLELYVSRSNDGDSRFQLARYTAANVFHDSGICWGQNAIPKSLREANSAFWSAPFNSDLWSKKEEAHDCRDPHGRRHRCEARRKYDTSNLNSDLCAPTHRCRDGNHHRPHVHVCDEKRAGGQCQVTHAFPVTGWSYGISSQRSYIRSRSLHLNAEQRERFKVTLVNNFGTADVCPCRCCSGQCSCQACHCCSGHCRCEQCPCENTRQNLPNRCNCGIRCNCCAGACDCLTRGCACNRAEPFADHVVNWLDNVEEDVSDGDNDEDWPTFRDLKRHIMGSVFVSHVGKCDGVFISSVPETMKRIPETLHLKDGGGYTCVAGVAHRQPDGTYRVTFSPDVTLDFKREELTQ